MGASLRGFVLFSVVAPSGIASRASALTAVAMACIASSSSPPRILFMVALLVNCVTKKKTRARATAQELPHVQVGKERKHRRAEPLTRGSAQPSLLATY